MAFPMRISNLGRFKMDCPGKKIIGCANDTHGDDRHTGFIDDIGNPRKSAAHTLAMRTTAFRRQEQGFARVQDGDHGL